MDEHEYIAVIEWYCRELYYNSMLTHAKEACDIYPNSNRLKILLSLVYALTGKVHETVKETSSLLNHADTTLPALLIQSIAYKLGGSADRTNVDQLVGRIREERRRASSSALSSAALILLLSGKMDKAKDYADRAYRTDPTDVDVLMTKGWLELYLLQEENSGKSSYFETVLKDQPKHFGALLGSASFKRHQQNYSNAIYILNTLITRYPKQPLPLIEKQANLFGTKDWEQVLENTNRILSIEANNLDALKANLIVVLCRDGDYDDGLKHLQLFFRTLIAAEPKNVRLFVNNVRLFSKLVCGHQDIISELITATEKMLQHNSISMDLMVQLGYLYILLRKPKDAEHWFRNAIRIGQSSFAALMGLAQCKLFDTSSGMDVVVHQQIDFLMAVQTNTENPELLFMCAKRYENDDNSAMRYLDMSADILLKNCESIPFGYNFLEQLNPHLCLQIAKRRLQHSLKNSLIFEKSEVKKQPCVRILEILSEACPGLSMPLLLLSKIQMESENLEEAYATVKKLLDGVDSSNAQAHLLMAQILARQGNFQSASQSLEVGLSYNFKIREDPIYHLIMGMVQKENCDFDSCIKSYQVAMSSLYLKNEQNEGDAMGISALDKVTLYLELVSAHGKMKQFDEAFILMEKAQVEFAGTSEEGKIMIGYAELYLEKGEPDRAISYLSKVKPSVPYYLEAHTRQAEIYLTYRRDRLAFAKCFKELVDHCPGPKTYNMLGDAYISIQEPECAIEAYEQALSQNPPDKIAIANKMGKALIKTHQYTKAINYYKDMIKNEGCRNLKFDLSELFMKMKQYDKAESTLVQELQDSRGESDMQSLVRRGQLLLLLAKVQERAGNVKGALSTLTEAKENQSRYVQRLAMDSNTGDQKQLLANICLTMADHASSLRDYEQAIMHYKDALNHKPADIKALLSLAKLYMQMNNLDRCTQSCTALLNADPNNEAASVMMADLAFRKVDFETAAFHFRQLLMRRPTYWTALARLIEVSRRTGNMDDLKEWLSRAATATDTSGSEAGYYYCAGLFDWRMGKLNSALRNFNYARRDAEWGQQAIYNMVEICLDPDDDSSLSSEVFVDEDSEYQDSRTMALNTAYRLLQELNPKGSPHEMLMHRLLGDFFLLATKQKSNIEKALQDCTALASQEAFRDHVGPALGMAVAHILLKQTPRARNHLKRVSKNVWTFEEAEYLERCWLLLADIYVQSSKYDLANDLLKRVLQHNATCVRAHELAGYIAEKDQNYREGALRYAQAWKYGGKSKLYVGYKLAYCCMKAKGYADAIDACNEVLKQNIDYPRIKKDILEKCINNLRT